MNEEGAGRESTERVRDDPERDEHPDDKDEGAMKEHQVSVVWDGSACGVIRT